MSSKFWKLVLEANVDNIDTFQPQIEQEESKNNYNNQALTLRYLVDKQLRYEFDNLSTALDRTPVHNKAMILPSDEPPIVKFKEELKDDLDVLHQQIMEEYELMKEYFSSEFINQIKHKKKTEEHDIKKMSDSLGNIALHRDNLIVETTRNDQILAKILNAKVRQKSMIKVFNILKKNAIFVKGLIHRENLLRKKTKNSVLRRAFDALRSDTHNDFKQRHLHLEPMYYQQRKEEVIDEWDNLIEGLRGYIEQLQEEIKLEVNAKAELAKIYEVAMNGSVKKFVNANEFVNTQINEYRQTTNFNDTFGRAGETQQYKSQFDIGKITLVEQEDPEEEEKYQ
jgi:hypothetical protein